MAERRPLTKQAVEGIASQAKDVFVWDSQQPGFGVRVTPAGRRSYVYQFRVKSGPQRRMVLGQHGPLTVQKARDMARDLYEQVRRGRDPVAENEAQRAVERADAEIKRNRRNVTDVLDQFMERYVTANQLRSRHEYQSAFDRLVKPAIGNVEIHSLRRSQIAEMLDRIEDENGPVMAHNTLAYLRKALNWYASRDDEFNSPIVKGMGRIKPRERARRRILSDDELREIWPLLGSQGMFGAFVRVLLLTGQRRDEVAYLRRAEIADDGVWSIPAERYKTKRANIVPLSAEALALIEAQPVRPDGYVFSTNLGNSGKPKERFDKAIAQKRTAACPPSRSGRPRPGADTPLDPS